MKKYTPILLVILLQSSLSMIGYSLSTIRKIVYSPNIRLSEKWSFQLDSLDKGIKQQWYSHSLKGQIVLPGSLTCNNIGDENRSRPRGPEIS